MLLGRMSLRYGKGFRTETPFTQRQSNQRNILRRQEASKLRQIPIKVDYLQQRVPSGYV